MKSFSAKHTAYGYPRYFEFIKWFVIFKNMKPDNETQIGNNKTSIHTTKTIEIKSYKFNLFLRIQLTLM